MPGQLATPPLVEALLEIKWNLNQTSPDTFHDPGFKWAVGRLYDKIKRRFGHIKNLPIHIIPEEMTAYTVRHQFRASENGWPLVQIGPGIATVNFTSPYSWKQFKQAVKFFIPHLIDSYQGVTQGETNNPLVLNSVVLRYINAIEWNWESEDSLEYLSTHLHTSLILPEVLTDNEKINGMPKLLNLQVGYPIAQPIGNVLVRFSTGTVGQAKGLIWEIIFTSDGNQAPQLSDFDSFMAWLTQAHDVVEKWFFELIDGELEDQFGGARQ